MGTRSEKPREIGGARRDRTVDLLHAMQALSQLSYSPTEGARRYASLRILSSARSMRAHTFSGPSSATVISIGGETAAPVTATRKG